MLISEYFKYIRFNKLTDWQQRYTKNFETDVWIFLIYSCYETL